MSICLHNPEAQDVILPWGSYSYRVPANGSAQVPDGIADALMRRFPKLKQAPVSGQTIDGSVDAKGTVVPAAHAAVAEESAQKPKPKKKAAKKALAKAAPAQEEA